MSDNERFPMVQGEFARLQAKVEAEWDQDFEQPAQWTWHRPVGLAIAHVCARFGWSHGRPIGHGQSNPRTSLYVLASFYING